MHIFLQLQYEVATEIFNEYSLKITKKLCTPNKVLCYLGAGGCLKEVQRLKQSAYENLCGDAVCIYYSSITVQLLDNCSNLL